MTMPNIALRNAVPSGNSLQQISTMLHCHFALFALSNSSHPSSALTISYLTASHFRVHYLSPEVTVKVTAQLLLLNAQRPLLVLRLIGTFKAKDRAMHDQPTFASWLRQHRKALDLT
jgi:hypothetical protein